ncbi:ABC transporter sub-family G-like protein 16 [Sarcoptes scabiei]|uniref:ABC transporter sub-family G-like protein 16 n=1 Tax=Sarcoptes scabiei TaxID=52283 RepID=A0A132ACK4_SARSC|nr:ABC transporter sub-family G-like protein 16 [Sarcoptes scabiei]
MSTTNTIISSSKQSLTSSNLSLIESKCEEREQLSRYLSNIQQNLDQLSHQSIEMLSSSKINPGFVHDIDTQQEKDGQKTNISLAWRNLRFEVKRFPFSKSKIILKRLVGCLEYHSLNAFLGPSGAGKTTLLNCLNGNCCSELTRDSEIYANKHERQSPKIGFIEQHVNKTIIGSLTIQEILRCAFLFKNGWKSSSKISTHIETIMKELLLDPQVIDRRFEQCSGGEQKRIAVAQELMSLIPPSLLFVDEPTTGLDSNAALLQKLNIEISDEKPPIERYLKIACNGLESEQVQILANQTIQEEHKELSSQLDRLDFLPWGTPRRLKRSTVEDFLLQIHRLFRIVFVVDWKILLGQIVIYLLSLVMFGFFFDSDMINPDGCYSSKNNMTCSQRLDDDSLMESYVNYQSYCLMLMGFGMIGMGSIVFAPLLKVFRNEHRNRWYSMGTFFWSYLLVRFVEMTIFTILITITIYFPTGHYRVDLIESNSYLNWNRFGHFLALFWLNNIYTQSLGHLVSVIFLDKEEVSLIISHFCFIILCLLNGYLIILEHMDNPILLKSADLMASNVISKALLWSFYGLNRCDDGSDSIILYKFYVNPDTVYKDLIKVIVNTLILRMATIIIMYLKFDLSLQFRSMIRSRSQDPVPIDFPEIKQFDKISRTPLFNRRIKQNNEIEFEQFSRHKIIVAWRNLTLFGTDSIHEIRSASKYSNSKKILRDLNGQFCFGTMNALMGTSGSGKTSLLRVLNGQCKTHLSDETQIYLSRFTPTRICYLTQDVSEHLLPGLTAKQSLIYASRLKNQHSCDDSIIDHDQIAMNLLNELDISTIAETFVQNCSGGERKKLALALELTSLTMPNLICIDEPTSGLDSNSAEIMISCLRDVVYRHNITIIASIHQPNTELINMFDQIYVLARGGVSIFFGPPSEIRSRLQTIDDQFGRCSVPLEELIRYSCLNHENALIKRLVEQNDCQIRLTNITVESETCLVSDGIPLNRIRFSIQSLPILCSRYLRFVQGYSWHHWIMFIGAYLFYAIVLRYIFDPKIALTDGCFSLEDDFNQICNKTKKDIEEEINLTSNGRYNFFAFNIFILLILLQCGLNFMKEIIFFFNEHRNGWYSTGVFYLTKFVYEITLFNIIITLYLWIIDIYEPIHPGIYWWMFLLLNLGVQAIQGLSHFVSLLSNGNSFVYIAMANFFYSLMIMTANFFSKISSLHYMLQAISNLSICRFMIEGVMVLQYGFGRCGPKQLQVVLYNLDITGDHYFYHCLKMLIFQIFVFRILALIVLAIKSNPLENRRRRVKRIIDYHQQIKPSNAIVPGLSSHLEFRIKKVQL